eukprot:TRINITY_DN2128_c0_g2_i7.p1 TRINITY_DN2128_c0_g2~~TRINITY_DN2128_c0_g2_i7.p1  ORF type:complete len:368 (+),score=93.37 TRINITY_DN2128_c0_g2_i7:89-1192(+)
MACFGGKKSADEVAASKRNKEVEASLKAEKQNAKFKLLLLGTGDAGKSTFCKQMQVIHTGGFKQEEIDRFAEILRDNCITSMHTILLACKDWGVTFDGPTGVLCEEVLSVTDLTPKIAEKIITLSETEAVKKAIERANELQIPGGGSGAQYYFKHTKRFADPDYKPDVEDIMRAKMRTTGICEINFRNSSGQEFVMVDVGGQRSERRKWLHCFGDVTAVIFLVAINEYDMVLEEDNKTNRMEESLKLFSKLTGSQWFDDVSFLLFMNKSDLFKEKITTRPLTDYFEDFDQFVSEYKQSQNWPPKDVLKEDETYFLSAEYLKAQYVRAFSGKRLYPFLTCAIDKGNCEKVWSAVKDSIISTTLTDVGI